MTFVSAVARRSRRAVRVAVVAGITVGGWIGVAGSARAAAATTRSEATAALVPFAVWVGRLPADQEETWKMREALAFYRGRLGVWMEAELQAGSTRLPVERQFELRVALARAARCNEEWDRARGWITAAGEVLPKIPDDERTWQRLAAYYTEAGALRELTDVRVAYAGLKDFLDGELAPADRFEIYRRLVDIAVVAGDKENYSKLATALLTTAREWDKASPAAAGETSAADQAMAAYADTLLRRGQGETALGLLDIGIANPKLRAAITESAADARVAAESEEAVVALLHNLATPRERLQKLAGTPPDSPGLAVWLLRNNRLDLVVNLLGRERDELLDNLGLADRDWRERTWNDVVRRAVEECFQSGHPGDAVRLAELYGQKRQANVAPAELSSEKPTQALVEEGRLLDVDDGLVAIADLLGKRGETEPARRLLAGLPFEYPRRAVGEAGSAVERMIREQAAKTMLHVQRIALVSAWSAAGGIDRAQELLDDLAKDDSADVGQWDAMRPQLLAEIAAAAAIQGNSDLAAELLADAHGVRSAATQVPVNLRVAFVTAQVLSSQMDEGWDEVKAAGEDAVDVASEVLRAVLVRGRGNRVLEWISVAPDEYRRVLWPAFFQLAIPDPAVPPVAPSQ